MSLEELQALAAPLAATDAHLGRFLDALLTHIGGLHERITQLEGAAESFAQRAATVAAQGEK